MNERLRELKEQALIWAVETLDPDALNDNEWGVAIDAKFAELIVQECLEACSRANEIRHFVPPGQQQVVLDCMREIEETFRS